jgi:hypothetical protein
VPEIVCGPGDQGFEEPGDLVAVIGISPGGGGWACSAAAVTDRKARASMARVTHRYQGVQ